MDSRFLVAAMPRQVHLWFRPGVIRYASHARFLPELCLGSVPRSSDRLGAKT